MNSKNNVGFTPPAKINNRGDLKDGLKLISGKDNANLQSD